MKKIEVVFTNPAGVNYTEGVIIDKLTPHLINTAYGLTMAYDYQAQAQHAVRLKEAATEAAEAMEVLKGIAELQESVPAAVKKLREKEALAVKGAAIAEDFRAKAIKAGVDLSTDRDISQFTAAEDFLWKEAQAILANPCLIEVCTGFSVERFAAENVCIDSFTSLCETIYRENSRYFLRTFPALKPPPPAAPAD